LARRGRAYRCLRPAPPGGSSPPYLRTLARPAAAWPGGPVPEQAFIDAGLDLAAAALRMVAGYPDRSGTCSGAAVGELTDYAMAHLADPGLSPRAAAQAGFVSVRQVHRLFAGEGTTFGGWVREQRLRRCRDDLADPRLGHLTVAEIATRWGFRSAAHFTRAFHARYGTTPAELRSHATPFTYPMTIRTGSERAGRRAAPRRRLAGCRRRLSRRTRAAP
jgi:AraC-like DNA-binding protein